MPGVWDLRGLGCPAIEFEGDVAKINSLCTGCGVCKGPLPSSVISGGGRMGASARCDIVIVGVGGQGVILISECRNRQGRGYDWKTCVRS